jgi:predicted DNA-binding antitoxin AbrB/MazE fold protein
VYTYPIRIRSFLGVTAMSLEVEATYENACLKLDKPLPLSEHQRVIVSVRPYGGRIEASAGLIPCKGNPQEFENLLGPDNLPWAP